MVAVFCVMKRSVNEIHGMVLKAARGAGLPLGCCEDLASAAAVLARRAPDQLDELRAALAEPHEAQACSARIDKARVARIAPAAIDHLLVTRQPVELADTDAPHLLKAYAEVAATLYATPIQCDGAGVLTLGGEMPPPLPPIASVEVDEDLWRALGELAHRIYVPASEASRVAGAGAGLTDND